MTVSSAQADAALFSLERSSGAPSWGTHPARYVAGLTSDCAPIRSECAESIRMRTTPFWSTVTCRGGAKGKNRQLGDDDILTLDTRAPTRHDNSLPAATTHTTPLPSLKETGGETTTRPRASQLWEGVDEGREQERGN